MFCKKCGKKLQDGTAFCPFCGQKQMEDVSGKEEKKTEQFSNKHLFLTGAVMAAVILAVIAGFKLVGREKAGEPFEEEAAQEGEVTAEEEPVTAEEEPVTAEGEPVTAEGEPVTTEEEPVAEPEATVKPSISHIAAGENSYWFDEDGDLVEVKEGTYRQEFQYLTDAEGKKVKGKIAEKMLDIRDAENTDMMYVSMYVCAVPYNAKGHLLENWNWEGDWSSGSAAYAHDGENMMEIHLMEQRSDGESDDSKSSLRYDEENNQLMISSQMDGSNESVENFTYFFDGNNVTGYIYDSPYRDRITEEREYDASGNLIRKKYEDADTISETVCQYQFDTYGNMTRQVKKIQEKREDKKSYEDHITIDFQYDESGNKVQEKFNQESMEYDEAGTLVKQSGWDRNYIWEYDTEGRLVYYSSLFSSTGNDVKERESEYLYDEQGRLTEILTDGETVMVFSYSDEGVLRQIDLEKELEGKNFIEWSVIENLFPKGEMAEIVFFGGDVLKGENIVIEYR